MSRFHVLPLLVGVAVVALGLAGCGGVFDDESGATSVADTTAAAPSASAPAETPAGATGNGLVGIALADLPPTSDAIAWRVVEQDGAMLPATKDLRCGRHDLVVVDGAITSDAVECSNGPVATAQIVNGLVGLVVADLPAADGAFDWRVVELDGQPQAVTMDIRCGRHDLAVTGGTVTSDIVACAEDGADAAAPADTAATSGAPDAVVLVGTKVADLPAPSDALVWRIVEQDGQPQAVTSDLRCGRHNLTVESGVVTGDAIECAEDDPAAAETTPAATTA